MHKTISMLSWSRITEGETLDSADFDFLLSKKKGFVKTIQYLKKKKNDENEKQFC
jgi:hypothetical protein